MGNNTRLITEKEYRNELAKYTEDEIVFVDRFISVSTKMKIYNKTKDIYWNTTPSIVLTKYKNNPRYLQNSSYLKRGSNIKSLSHGKIYYTIEKCQDILAKKSSTYEAVDIKRGDNRYEDICIVECKHGRREIKCKDFYRYDFVCLQCRHEKRDQEKIDKIKNVLENTKYSFYKFEVDRSNIKDHKYYVHLYDTDGYYYISKYRNLEKNIKTGLEIVNRISPYNLLNIKIWLKLNNSNIEIVSSEYEGNTSILNVKCLLCGNEFNSYWVNIQHGSECPLCSESHGEKRIKTFFEEHGISYQYEKRFDDLRGVNNGYLSYDFYVEDYNVLIEYSGIQHYQPVDYWGGEKKFIIQQEHDKRKRNYAIKNNYGFVEIPYWDFNKIEAILSGKFGLNTKSA